MVERYQRALIREIEIFSSLHANDKVDSIYLGGSTPSLLPAPHIKEIITACRANFSVAPDCEISIEANPDTLAQDKVEKYLECGINRISLGVQTFSDSELQLVGRRHTRDSVIRSLHCLHKCGFVNINVDLMLGLPLQTAASWSDNVKRLIDMAASHISVYMLDLDESTPLGQMVGSGRVRLPDEDLVADLYLETSDRLASCGYEHYEISNFARPGFACRHNLKYWTRLPVYGLGLGSFSFDGHMRQANHSSLDDYLRLVEQGKLPISSTEELGQRQALQETLFLGLRLTRGINWKRLTKKFGARAVRGYEKDLKRFCDEGLTEWNDGIVRLTKSGMLLANEVLQVFV